MERRKEKRLAILNHHIPFLGTRERDGAGFLYILMDMSRGGLRFALPNLTRTGIELQAQERICFHIPFNINGEMFDSGTVIRLEDDPSHHIYGASLDGEHPVRREIGIDGLSAEIELSGVDLERDLILKAVHKSGQDMATLLREIQTLPLTSQTESWLKTTSASQPRLDALHQTIEAAIRAGQAPDLMDLNEFIGLLSRNLLAMPPLPPNPSATARRLYPRHNDLAMLYINSLNA